MKHKIAAAALTGLVALPIGALANPIVVDPTADRTVAVEVPLFGYRKFPQELFTIQKGNTVGLPTELIYAAAADDPRIQRYITASGESVLDLEAQKLIGKIKSQGIVEEQPEDLLIGSKPDTLTGPKTVVPWAGGVEVDAKFITSLVSSELVSDDVRVFEGDLIEENVEMVALNLNVLAAFRQAYDHLENLESYDPALRVELFQEANMKLARYPALLESAKINFSPVSFGEVFAFSYSEKDLAIPLSILNKYDVYWVEFPVNIRDLSGSDVVQLSFHVFLPESSIALDLIPRRFGVTAEVSERSGAPELEVTAGGASVKVGKLFSRTVEYTLLRPTIVATGLREPHFSWVLTGDAVSTGAYIFVGVLGVPKEAARINVGYSVNLEVSEFWGLQGDAAGTGIIFDEIVFY